MYVACGENYSWVEGRITRLPLLPCVSQLFLSLQDLGDPLHDKQKVGLAQA